MTSNRIFGPPAAIRSFVEHRTLAVHVRAFLVALALLLPVDALAGQISLAWDASPTPGVSYRIYYGLASGNHPNVVDAGTQTTYTVPGLTDGVRYYFVVRAVAGGGTLSSPSNEVNGVPGSTLSFTDHPLLPGVHVMKVVHMTELRSRIDGLRKTRNLGSYAWTSIGAGTLIRAAHVNELRSALNPVYQSLGLPLPVYTESISVGMPIKAVHISELRGFVIALGG